MDYFIPEGLAKLEGFAKTRLSAGRYYHSCCVKKQAGYLAEIIGADVHKAEIAGILHDICKEMPKSEQLQYMRENGILLSNEILQNPGVWHGFVAALWIKENLNIHDDEISSAIYHHSTGKPDMTLLEKVLFLADLTSSDRNFADVKALRSALEDGIDTALVYCLGFKIEHSRRSGKLPLDETQKAYQYYTYREDSI